MENIYSVIRSVRIDKLVNHRVEIYPNPTNNHIIIIGSDLELETISVYNILGENVTNKIFKPEFDC